MPSPNFKKDLISKQCICVEENQKICILAPALHLTSCMNLGKSCFLFGIAEGKQLTKFTQQVNDRVGT